MLAQASTKNTVSRNYNSIIMFKKIVGIIIAIYSILAIYSLPYLILIASSDTSFENYSFAQGEARWSISKIILTILIPVIVLVLVKTGITKENSKIIRISAITYLIFTMAVIVESYLTVFTTENSGLYSENLVTQANYMDIAVVMPSTMLIIACFVSLLTFIFVFNLLESFIRAGKIEKSVAVRNAEGESKPQK